jgi:beta-lysine 5,6-aminomutase alpha subunit
VTGSKLNLDPAVVAQARVLARRAAQPVVELARTHTTVSVERAVLRLAGLDGADPDGMPWVNRLADAVRDSVGLEHGAALPVWDAMLAAIFRNAFTVTTVCSPSRAALMTSRYPSELGIADWIDPS